MNRHVLGFLAAPNRETSLRAVSLALLKIRSIEGMTLVKLAEALDCSTDTLAAASNEESMLSFHCVAQLCYHFPDETFAIKQLWERGEEAPTVADRLERIERELNAIRKVAA